MPIILDGSGSITGLTSGAGVAAAALSGQVPDANAPSGSVIQVVSATKVDSFSSTSNSFVDITGLSVAITPSAASSRVMVFASISWSGYTWSTGGVFFNLQRNNTNISQGVDATICNNLWSSSEANTAGNISSAVINFLDSPNTTSAVTYKIQARNNLTGLWVINRRALGEEFRGTSTITVMEIAA